MEEREVLKNIAQLLWKNELERTAGMSLLEKENYLHKKHPLGIAGLQDSKEGRFLTLLIDGEFFELLVVKAEVEV